MNRRTVMAACVVVLGISLVLSGCSLVHLPGVPGASSTTRGVTIPGLGSAGTGKLPKDFPAEVPIIAGDIVTGLSLGAGTDKVWNVSVKVSGVDDFDKISAALTSAGFAESGGVGSKDANGATAAFVGTKYAVAVVVVKSDEKTGWVADYTVTPAPKSDG